MSNFELGLILPCKIHKKIEIEGVEYFLILDPFENKHLVQSNYYENYNLEVEKTYNFRVDKINCKGYIFFEPEHPYYKINQIYQFQFSEKKIRTTKKGDKNYFFIYTDKYETICELTVDETKMSSGYIPEHTISAKIVRIKKGVLLIE